MSDLNRDTGGTSQRRGVHGDPWRTPSAQKVHVWRDLEDYNDPPPAARPVPGIPFWEKALFVWALCVFIGAIAAGIVAAQY